MADGCESFVVAGALCATSAERIHAICLFHLFSFPSDSGWNSLLPARFEKLLGGDDVFGRRVRVWLYHLDVLPGAEPVVHICGHVAQQSCGRAVHGPYQLDREMWPRTRRGVSFAARRGCNCRTLGCV